MKQVLIIRHAESLANIGERTDSHSAIPLSEVGKKQAEDLVTRIDSIPDLIVVSPYTRTYDTAKPFIEKYSSVPVETWDVHEFTYLSPKQYSGTSREERWGAITTYWESLNIHYRDGDDSETFYEFVIRIKNFINKVTLRPEKNIIIFSHGGFIKNLLAYLASSKNEMSDDAILELMKHNRSLLGVKYPIENVSIHTLEF